MSLANFATIYVSPQTGHIIEVLFLLPVVMYLIARIIDPVVARRWESRYWHRFPEGTMVPRQLDADALKASRPRRIRDRINAAIMLGFITLLLISLKSL